MKHLPVFRYHFTNEAVSFMVKSQSVLSLVLSLAAFR